MVDHRIKVRRRVVDPAAMAPPLAAFFDYWLELPQARRFPLWGGAAGDGFRLIDLSNEILPMLAVVEVEAGAEDVSFVYRYWGAARSLYLGDRPDPTGKRVATGLPNYSGEAVFAQYQAVCREQTVILTDNIWPLGGGLSAECQTLRLPLTRSADDTVNVIASATIFLRHAKEFRQLRDKLK